MTGSVVGGGDAGFDRWAGWAAILTGVSGLGYAIAFLSGQVFLQAVFLTLAPLFGSVVIVALYRRLRDTEPSVALWALLFGIGGALGSIAHGGYDLANVLHPPAAAPDIPFPVDPRGMFTFGLTGLALLAIAWLVRRSGAFPSWLPPLAVLVGIILVATYLGRLVVLDPSNPVVRFPALAAGILTPILYLGLGWWLLRPDRR